MGIRQLKPGDGSSHFHRLVHIEFGSKCMMRCCRYGYPQHQKHNPQLAINHKSLRTCYSQRQQYTATGPTASEDFPRVDAFRSAGRGRRPKDVLQRLTSLRASELERLNTLPNSRERTGNLPGARKQFGIVDRYFVIDRILVDQCKTLDRMQILAQIRYLA